MSTGETIGFPKLLLRLEGAALFAGALCAFAHGGGSWVLFAALFLAPDVAMAGYWLGPRPGSFLYNLAHTTVLPAALIAAHWFLGDHSLSPVGLIWLAHIGFDRALGYGLKYPTRFHHTHLGTAAPVGSPVQDAT